MSTSIEHSEQNQKWHVSSCKQWFEWSWDKEHKNTSAIILVIMHQGKKYSGGVWSNRNKIPYRNRWHVLSHLRLCKSRECPWYQFEPISYVEWVEWAHCQADLLTFISSSSRCIKRGWLSKAVFFTMHRKCHDWCYSNYLSDRTFNVLHHYHIQTNLTDTFMQLKIQEPGAGWYICVWTLPSMDFLNSELFSSRIA